MSYTPNNDIPTGGAETISMDLPCTGCSYNLRGLSSAGRCPECGSPIGRSMHGDLLRFADTDWLETISKGTAIILLSVLVSILGGIIAGAVQSFSGTPNVISGLIGMVGQCVALWGVWLVTSPEPRNLGAEDTITLRKLVRFCAVVALVGGVINAVVQPTFVQSGNIGTAALVLISVVSLVLGAASLVQYFGQFVYFRRFARRIPDPKLEQSTTTVMWGVVVCWGVLILLGIAMGAAMALGMGGAAAGGGVAAGPPAGSAVLAVGGIGACGAGIGLLVLAIWGLVLLSKYRKALATAAEMSRRIAEYPATTPGSPQSDEPPTARPV